MNEEWQIRTTGASEVAFVRLGIRYLARCDHGRLDADMEYHLRRSPTSPQGDWKITVPDEWRGKPGAEVDGIRWLRIVSPWGSECVLEFYRGLGPHELGRAYEKSQEVESPGSETKGKGVSKCPEESIPAPKIDFRKNMKSTKQRAAGSGRRS